MSSTQVIVAKADSVPASLVRRFPELDSLRGIASLVVVFHHFGIMRFSRDGVLFHFGYPFVAGFEAVVLFFTLSGLVLALPYVQGKNLPYPLFITRRITRIYFPYLVSLALAVFGAALWHNRLPLTSWTAATWSEPVNAHLVWQHILFLGNYDHAQFNTAFWSLIQEMRVSLIFPALYLISRLGNRTAIAGTLMFSAVVQVILAHTPASSNAVPLLSTLSYVPMFLVGLLMAKNLNAMVEWYRKCEFSVRILVLVVSLTCYYTGHLAFDLTFNSAQHGIWLLGYPLITFGAAGGILVSVGSLRVRQLLDHPVPHFLGRISYSLYLVHTTILYALTAVIEAKLSTLLFLTIYLILSLLTAIAFCFLIEEPCHRLGRRWTNLLGGKRS